MSRNDKREDEDKRGAAEQDQYPGTDTSRSNQVRDEPVPASHHEEHDQEAVVRNEEHAAGDLETRPSGRGAGK
jgi:hypothetical protein